MKTKIVSFYCDVGKSTFYSDCAKRMIARCKKLGLSYYIKERNYGKTWIDNVRAKPVFLLETFKELREPFLWVDIDCDIMQPIPSIDKLNCDLASAPKHGKSMIIHDAVHYVGTSQVTLKLLKLWKRRCTTNPVGGSHRILNRIIVRKEVPNLRFKFLSDTLIKGPKIKIGISLEESKSNYFKKR